MADLTHIRIDRAASGVVTVWFDVQGSPVNVFNAEVMTELQQVVEHLERNLARVVVFRSAKPSGFFAGADIKQIQSVSSEADVKRMLEAGHTIFGRIEKLPTPTIAVIHGPCVGGGLEFALACRYRVARDDGSTRLGLPEVQLGIIPGWGGTQRLPKLVGLRKGIGMILEGSTLSAKKALAAGLVDAVIPAATFDEGVQRFVDDRIAAKPVTRTGRGIAGAFLDGTKLGRSIVMTNVRRRTASKVKQYPALSAIITAVEAGYGRGDGYAVERDQFAKVVFTDAAKSLMGLFFQREKARRRETWAGDAEPKPVKSSVVVGGGTMGAGIAQLLASNGVKVVLKEINAELAAAGKGRVDSLTNKAAEKGAMSREQAAKVIANVIATDQWEAVAGLDLAVEAVVERENVKREVFTELARRMSESVLATNTSSLSVTRIADGIDKPGRVAGLHFFNPVHKMQLVEVVRGKATDDAAIATLVELVRKLGKVPVVVADSPGFLVNRILFPYLDEAVRLATAGYAVEEIDREAVRFGMPMGPLELMDQVGIDVGADICGTLSPLANDPSPTPERLAAMAARGWKGKKSGIGFYEYKGEKRGQPTTWEGTPSPPPVPSANGSTDELTEIQKRLIYPMINEAAKCLEEGIVAEAWAVDLAMVLGTGFAPFRGGPLRFADRRGLARIAKELEAFRSAHGQRFTPCGLIAKLASEGRGFHGEAASPPRHPEEVH